MTIVFNGDMNIPNYTALSTDIVAGALPIAQPGRTVFISDTASWYIVRADGILVAYTIPAAVNVTPSLPVTVQVLAADVHAPSSNTAAVVSYGANATKKHVISGVAWSYVGGTPSGGNLMIQDGNAIVFTVDIDKSGPGSFEFPNPKVAAAINTAMTITLAAGGSGVTGKVSVENHWLE
jgi:hypothetical protein